MQRAEFGLDACFLSQGERSRRSKVEQSGNHTQHALMPTLVTAIDVRHNAKAFQTGKVMLDRDAEHRQQRVVRFAQSPHAMTAYFANRGLDIGLALAFVTPLIPPVKTHFDPLRDLKEDARTA